MIPVPAGPELPPERGWSQTTSKPIPAQHGYIVHPILDPVRGAALAAAVELIKVYGDMDGDRLELQVLAYADVFETYLAGKEADEANP